MCDRARCSGVAERSGRKESGVVANHSKRSRLLVLSAKGKGKITSALPEGQKQKKNLGLVEKSEQEKNSEASRQGERVSCLCLGLE